MSPADENGALTIRVVEVAGEEGTEAVDGARLYDLLRPALVAGREVELDFRDVRTLSEPFLAAAVGALLRDVPFEDLLCRLVVSNITVRDLQGLRYVLEKSRDETTAYGCREAGATDSGAGADGSEKP